MAIGWHFIDEGWALRYDLAGTVVKVGQTITVDENLIELCNYGLHASIDILDALSYRPTPYLCLVELGGKVIIGKYKMVGSERTVLAMADITSILYRFALWCAEQALALVENPDPCSLAALEVKRRWLDGKASDEELEIANSVAKSIAIEARARANWIYTKTREAQISWAKERAAWAAAMASERSTDTVAAAVRSAALATWIVSEMKEPPFAIARANQNAKLTEMVLALPEFAPFKGLVASA